LFQQFLQWQKESTAEPVRHPRASARKHKARHAEAEKK
jgi:hypothetical protein